jgi:signal transduction histidine kinase
VAAALLLGGVLTVFAIQQTDARDIGPRELRERAIERSIQTGLPFPEARDQVFIEQLQREVEREIDQRTFARLRTIVVFGLVALLVLSFAIGYAVSGLVLRPVTRITGRARELHDRAPDLSGRIDLGGPDDELKELADTLDAFLDRTEEAVGGQRRFLADASHELRTPVAAAQTTLDVVLEDPKAGLGDYRAAAATAREQLRRMGRLVSDLLLVERSAHRAPEQIVLADLIGEVVADLSPRAESRGIGLTVESAAGIAAARRDDLRRVLTNLIENAVVHNRPGGEVRVASEVQGDELRISVSDDGPGIDPDLRDTIFQRFHRAGHGDGTGLGLAIVRELTERMGGAVEVETPERGGARFVVRLPAAGA